MQATLLTSDTPDGNQSSHTTAAISPVEGRVYICAVACERSGNVVPQSVSGAGLTWSFVSSVVAQDTLPRRWLQVFIALADGNATTGQLTITSGASHARNWAVIELQDVTDAVRNLSPLSEQSGVTSLALTFGDAFDDPGNAALAFVLNTSGESQSQAGTDPDVWTQLADLVNPAPGAQMCLGVWVHDGETAGMTATWSTQADAGGLLFELPATGGGGPITLTLPVVSASSSVGGGVGSAQILDPPQATVTARSMGTKQSLERVELFSFTQDLTAGLTGSLQHILPVVQVSASARRLHVYGGLAGKILDRLGLTATTNILG